jgi:hypothetical protein
MGCGIDDCAAPLCALSIATNDEAETASDVHL